MKRVLIVDDELPIINGLSLLFKRYFQGGYAVVGTARSGREAIEKSKTLAPEIILMDVQMPGITGLDAIRELSQEGGVKAFILVTAYERFDIAREALSMGVCDYLLKPVSRERLEIALRAASSYLDRVRLLNERELEFRDRQQRLVPFVKTAFFVSACRKEYHLTAGPGNDLGVFREMLQLPGETGVMGIASFAPPDGNVTASYERFCSVLQYKTLAFAGPLEDMRHCAWFLPLKNETSASQELDACLEVVQTAFSAQLATGEIKLSYGQPENLETIGRSWETAVRLFARGQGSGTFPSSYQETSAVAYTMQGHSLDEWSKENAACALDAQFYDEIIEGRFAMAGQSLERMLLPLGSVEPMERDIFFRIIAALSFAASKLSGGGVLSEKRYREFMDFSDIERLWAEGASQLFASNVRARFQTLQGRAAAAGAHSPFVVRALQYIENHYQEPITLESAAEAIGISSGHLTRLMSDELKRGFARTLIEYRTQRAKELLKKPNVSIREVSRLCGYPDANYFARLFRRLTGYTPREYAARMTRGENTDA
jgi:two-component system response regulator YesN